MTDSYLRMFDFRVLLGMKIDNKDSTSRNMDTSKSDKQREKDAKERQKMEKIRAENERKEREKREKEQRELEKKEKKLLKKGGITPGIGGGGGGGGGSGGGGGVPSSATISNFGRTDSSNVQNPSFSQNQMIPNSKSETFLNQPKKGSSSTSQKLQVPKGRLRCQIIYLDESVKVFDVEVKRATTCGFNGANQTVLISLNHLEIGDRSGSNGHGVCRPGAR